MQWFANKRIGKEETVTRLWNPDLSRDAGDHTFSVSFSLCLRGGCFLAESSAQRVFEHDFDTDGDQHEAAEKFHPLAPGRANAAAEQHARYGEHACDNSDYERREHDGRADEGQ